MENVNLKYFTPADNYWVFDLEADDLDATRIWCVVATSVNNPQQTETFTEAAEFNDWLQETRPVLIGHNVLSFDVPTLNRLWDSGIAFDRCIDTLVLSFLADPKRDGGHSLAAWGFELGFPKIDFNDWKQFTPEMLEYCKADVELTRRLYEHLCGLMEDYSEQSAYIEHRSRTNIDRMQQHGVHFDVEGAAQLRDDLRKRESDLRERIHEVFPPKLVVAGVYNYRTKKDGSPYASYLSHLERYERLQFNKSGTQYRVFERRPFNIGSPTQRVERLQGIGWKPTQFTPKGNPKVDEESLVAFAKKGGNEAAQHMADWLVCNGRANMIENWIGYVDEERIHPRVFSCGAGSRRMRHTKPNTANIPGVGAPYGHECRSAWDVEGGRRMVGCDAKGLEGRVLVHYLGEPAAKEYFLDGDPHQANADAVGYERGLTKGLFYAFLYGATDRKLGSMVGKGPGEGARIRAALQKNIPGLERLVTEVQAEYQQNAGRLQTIDGGYVWCPSPHAALNYKFQSAGAIFMKVAAILLEDRMGDHYDAFKVLDVHDEWQFDCNEKEAKEVGQLMVEAMQEAGRVLNFNIEMDGDYKIGRNWAETH